MTAYGERSEDVRCPKHGKPLALVADGVLNGTRVTYWGQCPGGEPRGRARTCVYHLNHPRTPGEYCACREVKPPAPCHREVRVELDRPLTMVRSDDLRTLFDLAEAALEFADVIDSRAGAATHLEARSRFVRACRPLRDEPARAAA